MFSLLVFLQVFSNGLYLTEHQFLFLNEVKLMKLFSKSSKIKPSGFYWLLYTLPALFIYIAFMAYPLLDSMRLSMYTGGFHNMTFT
jgi:hypothetical protein